MADVPVASSSQAAETLLNAQKKHTKTQNYESAPWTFHSSQSHILPSQCNSASKCNLAKLTEKCMFCRYNLELDLPCFPDMVFPHNILSIRHKDGFGVEFNALDALKSVGQLQDPLKVACADVWLEARAHSAHIKEVVKPFDWTFTTNYNGTLLGKLLAEETTEQIDIEKLKQKEKILFYDDITLFEDELHDHGISLCSVKIRVMPSGFFLLLRFFLRVDDVMVRIADTRFHYESGNNYILREQTIKGGKLQDIKIPTAMLALDPSEIAAHLPLLADYKHKLVFPSPE